MFKTLKSRLFAAIAERLIRRAKLTPYFHLYHDDGRLYMERFWLVRFGLPHNWRLLEATEQRLTKMLGHPHISASGKNEIRRQIGELRAKLYPRFGIRIHHIVSSDEQVFHDHPWNFTTLILRGGYIEVTPDWPYGLTPADVRENNEYDGREPKTLGIRNFAAHSVGTLLRRKAEDWHYVQIPHGYDTWTLFCTGRKRQRWGFLVDGVVKVPYSTYLSRRAERAAKGGSA